MTRQGDFEHGLMHGDGVIVWKDGLVYTGTFQDNTITGAGKLEWPDGRCVRSGGPREAPFWAPPRLLPLSAAQHSTPGLLPQPHVPRDARAHTPQRPTPCVLAC